MSASANELERAVEASRSRLDGTLDKLRGRFNASAIVEDLLGTAHRSEAGAGLYDGALEAVRRSPVAVLLMCLGAVMLLKTKGPRAAGTYRAVRDPDRFSDPVGHVVQGLTKSGPREAR